MAVVTKFAARKKVPLTIALTPDQEKDKALAPQVQALKAYYTKSGRVVSVGSVKPGGVVESLQPLEVAPSLHRSRKTTTTDLVLFGTPANNVLLLDQARVAKSSRRATSLPRSEGSRGALHAFPVRRRMRRAEYHRHR